MKLVMDEKLKHRLIGLAVIISLGAIFAPAVVRKSSQRVEHKYSVNIKLPPRPTAPNVAATDEKELFKTVKVARVKVAPVVENKLDNQLVKARPINSAEIASNTESQLPKIIANSKPEPMTNAIEKAAKLASKRAVTIASLETSTAKQVASNTVPKKSSPQAVRVAAKAKAKQKVIKAVYAVQLASFSQKSNARSLVNKLHKKGYKASFAAVSSAKGTVYKVYAGHSVTKDEANKLKTQLASSMQLDGFVVNTEVS